MKVRITSDAIRIRLNQSEVRSLGLGGSVRMETVISETSRLAAVVQPTSVEALSVSLMAFSLTIDVPRSQLMSWANSDVISLESRQTTGSESSLTLLIEKDFHCLHRDSADDADTFPNPKLR
jgi:hypothetical protein